MLSRNSTTPQLTTTITVVIDRGLRTYLAMIWPLFANHLDDAADVVRHRLIAAAAGRRLRRGRLIKGLGERRS
ncbi:hypothetical protein GCK72_023638 [Caenorhabditis remanei]|uniref:Uncharacterized protein n=1 Tax=Caenorhabditis remanei TaxID=31234 RepID=A0A2P4WK99_CAERE|nr:hypothetical protein GCK72_023638 [Caenorhabditis remanei]KAF1747177.1 hypothetical protein GCK72_023638 [Caenorhabditis remanei]